MSMNFFKNNINRLKPIFIPSQLGYLIFYVTNLCNFRCKFCFYSEEINKGVKSNQLSLKEVEQFSKSIGPLMQLSMTGGEPFLRKDFIQVAEYLIKNTSAQYVTVPTNGSLEDRTFEFYKYLTKKFPDTFFRCVFSIEGIKDIHDNLRGVKGSYNKIENLFKKLVTMRNSSKNLILDSNSVFTKESEDTLLDTVSYLNNNFNFDNISVTYARGKIPDEKLKSKSKEKYIEINNFLESINRNKEKRRFSSIVRGINALSRDHIIKVGFEDEFVSQCVASKKIAVVSEEGDVYPCEILSDKIGNLRDYNYDLKEILKSKKNEQVKGWIKKTKCKCTFECATAASIAWNPKNYPKVISYSIRSLLRDKNKLN